ncbi:MAG: hypothetical protein R6W69_02650 [Anaerolineales bacterium]
MFDDFRKDAGSDSFADDDIERLFEPKETKAAKSAKSRFSGKFLGMTAVQRFVLSFLLFFIVCLGGLLALVALERIVVF